VEYFKLAWNTVSVLYERQSFVPEFLRSCDDTFARAILTRHGEKLVRSRLDLIVNFFPTSSVCIHDFKNFPGLSTDTVEEERR
jgi:hypothetical protein